MERIARANVAEIRQTTQYTCCAASIASALRALGKSVTEDDVNKVLGAAPMQGASWESILATVQYFGCRGSLVVPATPGMLQNWTDQGLPVIIGWNPEGRPWSHASVVYDVTDNPETSKRTVWVMDPNIPNPGETTRKVNEDEFCQKWYEKMTESLIMRRPALFLSLEVSPQGRQMIASRKANSHTQSKHKINGEKQVEGVYYYTVVNAFSSAVGHIKFDPQTGVWEQFRGGQRIGKFSNVFDVYAGKKRATGIFDIVERNRYASCVTWTKVENGWTFQTKQADCTIVAHLLFEQDWTLYLTCKSQEVRVITRKYKSEEEAKKSGAALIAKLLQKTSQRSSVR